MKQRSFILIIVSSLFLSGCGMFKGGLLGVKDSGEMKAEYSPVYIDEAPDSELAYIKSSDNLIIVKVNGERKVNFAKVALGQGIDSIKIKEGHHTIMLFLGVDIHIRKTFFKKGHEYFIDYAKKNRKIHYWIKDLTENKIIYGKEIKSD